jgi:hypothetical protein
MPEDDMKITGYSLEPIMEYGLDPVQAKAYKAMLLWLVYSREVFPDYKFGHNQVPKGDPRKSHVWRCCYKMVRELDGRLKDDEIGLYVRAQLMILRVIEDEQGGHPLIDPHVLVSQQSWPRWCVWKKRYDQKQMAKTAEKAGVEPPPDRTLLAELDRTKQFIEHVFQKSPTFEDVKLAYANRSLIRWIKLKKMSPLYVVLSPWVRKLLSGANPEQVFLVDLSGYKVTDGLRKAFLERFPQEA